MNNIKFGSTEYFELIALQDQLKSRSFDKLGLINLERLRFEVDMGIKKIDLLETQRRKSNTIQSNK